MSIGKRSIFSTHYTDSELWNKVCLPIYRELFKNAKPSCDLDKLLLENKEIQKSDWFMKYYLEEDKQQEIIKKHCKNHKLSMRDTNKVMIEIALGFSPKGFK